MSVTQLSVFVQSKPGHLGRVLADLASVDVSLRGFSAADTGDFGIVRLIVDRPSEALTHLEAAGYAVQATQVLCARLANAPGELQKVLALVASRDINVVYGYSLTGESVAFCVEDMDSAVKALAGSGLELLDQDDIGSLPMA